MTWHFGCVTAREGTHDEEAPSRPRRADTAFEEANHTHRSSASIGSACGRVELERGVEPGRGDPLEQVEEQCRAPATPAGSGRCLATQSEQGSHPPPGRGFDSALRARPVPVWFDRNRVEPGPQHAARLRGSAWRGRCPADQRVRGEAGVEGETHFLFPGGRGHDGAGGGHSLPKRNEVDGRLHVDSRSSGSSLGQEAQAVRQERCSPVSSSQGDAARFPALWEDFRAEEAWGGSDDGASSSGAGEACEGAEECCSTSSGIREGGFYTRTEISRGHASPAPADSVLAPHGLGRREEDNQPHDAEVVLSATREMGEGYRVWVELGDYPVQGRFRSCPCCERPEGTRRFSLRAEIRRGMQARIWPSAQSLRLRQSRSQRGERGETGQARGPPHWTGPPRADRMGGQRFG